MEKLNINHKDEVPKTAKERIVELKKLPLKDKLNLLPLSGQQFRFGPFIYKVTFVNGGDLRFSAKLEDIVIEGINDGESKIIDPRTGKNFTSDQIDKG